jgi:hypothetical protein
MMNSDSLERNPFLPPADPPLTQSSTKKGICGIWPLRLLLAAILLSLIVLTLSLLPKSLTGGSFDRINPFHAGQWILISFSGAALLISIKDFLRKKSNKWLVALGFALNLPTFVLLLLLKTGALYQLF